MVMTQTHTKTQVQKSVGSNVKTNGQTDIRIDGGYELLYLSG